MGHRVMICDKLWGYKYLINYEYPKIWEGVVNNNDDGNLEFEIDVNLRWPSYVHIYMDGLKYNNRYGSKIWSKKKFWRDSKNSRWLFNIDYWIESNKCHGQIYVTKTAEFEIFTSCVHRSRNVY